MSQYTEDYLDIRIRELMDETQAHLLRSSQPYGVAGSLRMMLRGRFGSAMIVALIVLVLALVAAIWAAIGILGADDAVSAIKFGTGLGLSALCAASALICLVVHMHAERTLRAVKRLEILHLARNRDPVAK